MLVAQIGSPAPRQVVSREFFGHSHAQFHCLSINVHVNYQTASSDGS